MKTIALTGDAVAQDAVFMQLRALITDRALPIEPVVGIRTRAQAYQVHAAGGELWQCGPYAPERDLVGQIDRVLPAIDFAEIAPQVVSSLNALLAKTHLTGEPA
jgi:hypothetical protein